MKDNSFCGGVLGQEVTSLDQIDSQPISAMSRIFQGGEEYSEE